MEGWEVRDVVGGGGVGNPFFLFIMRHWGLVARWHRCCGNFHEIVELFSIPVKIVMFLVWCVKSVQCTILLCGTALGQFLCVGVVC